MNKILISLFILVACGDDNFTGGTRFEDPSDAELEQQAPAPQAFRTRLNNTLLIDGEICRGDETILVNGELMTCPAGQYLVHVDDVNRCEPAGICTDFEVPGIFAVLVNTNADTSGTSVFDINPTSPTTSTQDEILENAGVITDINGNGTVFLKSPLGGP